MNEDSNDNFRLMNKGAEQLRSQLVELDTIANKFGSSLTTALGNSIIKGRSFSGILSQVGLSMSRIALKAAMQPLQSGISSLISGLITRISPFAKGGVPGRNGVISQPTYFPIGTNHAGVAGEAGREAILPLARGSDGRLGVRTNSAQSAPISVVFNVTANDAQSFNQAESQISAMLARAVSRGQRGL